MTFALRNDFLSESLAAKQISTAKEQNKSFPLDALAIIPIATALLARMKSYDCDVPHGTKIWVDNCRGKY